MRRPAFAACSLMLILAVSACGGSTGGREKPAASNPLAAAAGRTENAGTARIAAISRGSLGSMQYTHRRSGVIDFAHGYSSLTQRSMIGGEAQPSSRHVQLDGYLYDQIAGQWVKQKEGDGDASAAGDVTRLVDYLQTWSSGVAVARHLGGGVVYRAKLDLNRAIEDDLHRHGWTDSAIQTFMSTGATAPATVEASVGRDGLIHHLAVSGGVNGEKTTLDLSDFGLHVDAVPPA